MFKPIQIDRKNLTIMGVPFPDLEMLERAANAIGSNMYEGFHPTESKILLIREYLMNKITFSQFIEAAKDVAHV
ncbi:hypothetical protein M2480_000233 [Parabacteroides sp. PFB2-12]|uniref:antitoxin VbhA family protein n=1 Tax=unclassified Parabacteroides TaxID=2649774 RepID=UPI0024741789|nr:MULTISPECIES: antitoxin VbhA family protein [unclassified Parabacteroides]MDH6341481.1 hypothetical protein [Parabacteroides sp. PM6-13]MDH6389275.1 hypothetical protein [Parabacteroides sp. PFB2-12]MDL2309519.1 antitoxin VbhA family protein [Parabacteroides sp. OttesenSCG-928-B22]